jgi:peroxiredoxin
MSLDTQLKALQRRFVKDTDPDILEAMKRADDALQASGIIDRALRAGDVAPDFALKDASGAAVSLSSLLLQGPVVLSYYRGDWCPYCVLELSALAEVHEEIQHLGAHLVAISPQAATVHRFAGVGSHPAFTILIDVGAKVAERFGVAFSLADELRPIYQAMGHALPEKNAAQDWLLPIPATYVIGQDGRIALSYLNVDYSKRLEPADVLVALKSLQQSESPLRTGA